MQEDAWCHLGCISVVNRGQKYPVQLIILNVSPIDIAKSALSLLALDEFFVRTFAPG